MDNERPIAPLAAAPLSDRLGYFALPAMHLWWRFTWRVLLLPIASILIVVFGSAVFGSMGPHYRLAGLMGAVMGLGLLWFLLVPLSALYGIWLMRQTVFLKPFLYRNIPYVFVVTSHYLPLTLPLPLENALAIWWGITWRAWLGTLVAMMLLFFLGPLHVFLEAAITYLSFLWVIADPYGHTRLTIVPVGT